MIRRLPGPFTIERLVDAPALIDFAGDGSIDQAFTALIDLHQRLGSDGAGEVGAYFETAGVGLAGSNLDERLRAYADRYHVDPRTALRHSDRGAERLSAVIRDGLTYARPWASLTAVQWDDQVNVSVTVEVPEKMRWRRPLVFINGEEQPGREFELHDSPTHPLFVSAMERFPNLPLVRREDDELLEVSVAWVMPVWPSWQARVNVKDPHLYVTLTSNRNHSADLSFHSLSRS